MTTRHTRRLIAGSTTATLDTSVLYPPSLRLPRYQQAAAILTEFQASHGFTASAGTFVANDTSDFVRGSQSAKITTAGDNATCAVSGTVATFDSTGRLPRITVKIDNPAVLNSLIIDLCTDTSWANGWTWTAQGTTGSSLYLTAGEWVTQTLGFADAVKLGTGPRSGLGAVRIRVRDIGGGAGNAVTVHLQGVELVADGTATFPNGVVALTFDDSYADALTLGKPRLDLYGYPATSFVIADLIGTSGRLSLADLRALQDDSGWDLACHAATDADHGATFTGLTAAALDADARLMKAYAVTNGFRAPDLIAYPKGQYGLTADSASTTAILRKYFAAGLTTINKTRETYPPSDAFRLRRISGISSFAGAYQPATVTGTGGDLDQIKANGGLLILAFHEVVTSAPTSSGQITQTDFNTIIDAINSKGIPVMTVSEVLRYAATTAGAGASIDSASLPKKDAAIAATGVSTLAPPADHAHPRTTWGPDDHGLITAVADPALMQNSQAPAGGAGVLQLVRLHLPVAATITNVCLWVSTGGSGLTSGQCFAGLYTTSGNLLSATADQSTAWTSTGLKSMALSSSQALTAGDYYVGFFANGTTLPSFLRGVGSSAGNLGLSAANARFATAATGNTTSMPPSAGTLTGASAAFWAGLS